MRALKCQNTGNNITVWTGEKINTARSGRTEHSAAPAAVVSTLEKRPEFPARDKKSIKKNIYKKNQAISSALRVAQARLAQSHHCRGTAQVDPGVAQW